jgi:hypothetical protein
MKNLSHHTDQLCELVTSLLMGGIQLGDMSKLGWLLGFLVFPKFAVRRLPPPPQLRRGQLQFPNCYVL